MNSIIEQRIYEQARYRIGFRIHFIAFVVGISVNWIIWLAVMTSHVWPIWPTMGWSIGLLIHYLAINGNLFSLEREVHLLNKKKENN